MRISKMKEMLENNEVDNMNSYCDYCTLRTSIDLGPELQGFPPNTRAPLPEHQGSLQLEYGKSGAGVRLLRSSE